MPEYLLGLDNGSTVIKAAIFDHAGREVAISRITIEMISPEVGHYQRNLDDVKQKNLTVIKEVIQKAKINAFDIKGVAITGHGNGLYLVDENGEPTFDGISSADSRADNIVKKWYADGTAAKVLPLTLQSLWPGQPPAIITWFKQNKPEVLQKTRWMMLAKDYIRYLLTGVIVTERTDISGVSLYNVVDDCYDDKILQILGISEYKNIFPEVKDSSEICGRVTKEVASATGLKSGTPVMGGLFDIHAAALACGVVEETETPRLNIVAGTWSINQYVTTKPQINNKLFMTSLCAKRGNWLITEGSATSASNLEWFVARFLQNEKRQAEQKNQSVYDICNKAIAETSADEADIIFLPFLFGSNVDAEISGTFLNLRMRHKRKHIIRAIYEGIVFSHRYHIEKLLTEMPANMEVVLAGGGANSNEWAQMFADILQVPVETTKVSELGALGASMVAGVGIGMFANLNDAAQKMVHVKRRFVPNISLSKEYNRKYMIYLKFIKQLSLE